MVFVVVVVCISESLVGELIVAVDSDGRKGEGREEEKKISSAVGNAVYISQVPGEVCDA